METFGQLLRFYREKAGLTQVELALLLGIGGLQDIAVKSGQPELYNELEDYSRRIQRHEISSKEIREAYDQLRQFPKVKKQKSKKP